MYTFNSGDRANASTQQVTGYSETPQSNENNEALGNTSSLLFSPNFYKIHLSSLGGSRDTVFNNRVSDYPTTSPQSTENTDVVSMGCHHGDWPLGTPVGFTFITLTEVGATARAHHSLFLMVGVMQSTAFTFPPWRTEP